MTPETDILEAVARALCSADGKNPDEMAAKLVPAPSGHGFRHGEIVQWKKYVKPARAALTVALDRMVEPSEGAIRAIDAACHDKWPNARDMAFAMNRALVSQLRKEALGDE